jgi:hypothetical protein
MMDQLVIPKVQWDNWIKWFRGEWKPGQHLTVLAETGGGKSNLIQHLTAEKPWVATLVSKKEDDTYDRYLANGFKRIKKWPPGKPFWGRPQPPGHYLLWPKIEEFSDINKLAPIFRNCLEDIFSHPKRNPKDYPDAGWVVDLADTYYLSMNLKLADIISELQFQVRALGVSEISELQRPRWVPRACWGQATHSFTQSLQDMEDLAEIRGLFKMTTRQLTIVTNRLEPYEWLYRNKANPHAGAMIISKPPLIGEE